jgi:hypothetical protein
VGVHTAWLEWLEQGGWWPLQDVVLRRIPPAMQQLLAVDTPQTQPAMARPAVAVFLDPATADGERQRIADVLATGPRYGGAQPPSAAVAQQRVRALFEAAAAARRPQQVRDADGRWYRRADGTLWNDPPRDLPPRMLRSCFPRLVRAALHHRPAEPVRSAEGLTVPDDPLTALLDRQHRAEVSDRLADLLDRPEVRALLDGLSPIYRETYDTWMLPAENVAADRGVNLDVIYKRRERLKKALAPVLRRLRSDP